MKGKLLLINKAIFPYLSWGFLIVTIAQQIYFFKELFLNPNKNGDETQYFVILSDNQVFSWSFISSTIAQPFYFLGVVINSFFQDPMLTNRSISFVASLIMLIFLFRFYKKNKFYIFFENNPFLNKMVLFNLFLAVFFIITTQFVGTSDMLSVCFALPAFLMLTENLFVATKYKSWLIGLLFALSCTTRPTFLVVFLAYLIVVAILKPNKLFSKNLIICGFSFIFGVAAINTYPLLTKGKISIDDKDPPKGSGIPTWFEMNYLMAKKWDTGEIPRTKWLSQEEVLAFKKANPTFDYPKNHLDVLLRDPGMYFRQMIRMFVISLYSSFRYLYFLFPFLILFLIRKRKVITPEIIKFYLFTVLFYFASLLIFMGMRIKMMEFRWMHILIVFYLFYSLDATKFISEKNRYFLINGSFALGILFYILNFLRDLV